MKKYIFRYDLSKQYKKYRRESNRIITKVLESGVYILGKEGRAFEKEFARYIGCTYGIGVASGTDALILALRANDIKPGDEVITTVYAPTPVPTAIIAAGGVPVFVDVDKETCLMDPSKIEEKISKKTKFIIPVHLFGSVCNMQLINKIAQKHRLIVLEDAAQAHGSTMKGKKVGRLGDIACFSFYPTKNLGGYGDGGIVLTNDKKIANKLRLLQNYGKKYNTFDSDTLGYNSRLDELQAAILRMKLSHLDKMNKKRLSIVKLYKKGLKVTPLEFLKEHPSSSANYHILTVLCRKNRDDLRKFLENHNIQTNVYYPKPLHRMNAFRKYVSKREVFPVSERMSKNTLALPLYPELDYGTVNFIIKTIKTYFKG